MAQSGKHGDRRKLEGKPEGLGHSPFSGLAGGTKGAPGSAKKTPLGTPGGDFAPSGQPSGHPEVLVQRERKGRGGKGVIMVLGLNRPDREILVQAAKKALGTGARIEGDDLVIQGDQADRVLGWLTGLGYLGRRTN